MPTKMRQEIAEIPEAVERLLTEGATTLQTCAGLVQRADPSVIVTIARGSSDHASTFISYAANLLLGLPVASLGPSIASIYGSELRVSGALSLSVSQSGQSPDIVSMTRTVRDGGALTLALTNNTTSDLARAAEGIIDICAGTENSVAATKTFVTSAIAGLRLMALVKGDRDLLKSIHALPNRLDAASQIDWSAVDPALDHNSAYTLGRGPTLAISDEAALKFKEVCQLHAESFSSAEVLHGPVAIVGDGFPVLAFSAEDKAEQGLADVADALVDKGAVVFSTAQGIQRAIPLPTVRTGHPLTDPLSLIVSFYAMIEGIAVARGLNPDMPRHLNKVTQTT